MKHISLIKDICFELYYTGYNVGYTNPITPEWLIGNIPFAADIINKDITRLNEELIAYTGNEYPTDLYEELESDRRLLIDLHIITDLEGINYSNPNHISNSIATISEKLTSQLDAKAHSTAYYDKYHCKRLAECLKELCEIAMGGEQ